MIKTPEFISYVSGATKAKVFFRLILGIAVILSVSSCSSTKSSVGGLLNLDTNFVFDLKVDANINPDDNHVPSPLVIRMYELKSDKAFSKANFLDIYEKDKESLGQDLIVKHELKQLMPGQDTVSQFVLAKEALYIGLYAEFLQYKGSAFKLVIPVVKNNIVSKRAVVLVSGNTIKMYQPPSATTTSRENVTFTPAD